MTGSPNEEDWNHIVNEDFRLDYFHDLSYLMDRVEAFSRRNIFGVYRNPDRHLNEPPGHHDFMFLGYDLIEEMTQIGALTNCGGFPDCFSNAELNDVGLLQDFVRAVEVQKLLADNHPEEPHAECEVYAVWRLSEAER